MRTGYFALLMGVSLLAFGCNSATTETGSPTEDTTEAPSDGDAVATVNTHCPIMGGEVSADGGVVDWNGGKVGFCCPGCDAKWNELSDEDKATKLASAGKEDAGEETPADPS